MARRKWSTEEKINIALEGMAPGGNIPKVCRTHGILQPQYYKW
ncbi:transposase, partial [Aneurinibacillus migulanus]